MGKVIEKKNWIVSHSSVSCRLFFLGRWIFIAWNWKWEDTTSWVTMLTATSEPDKTLFFLLFLLLMRNSTTWWAKQVQEPMKCWVTGGRAALRRSTADRSGMKLWRSLKQGLGYSNRVIKVAWVFDPPPILRVVWIVKLRTEEAFPSCLLGSSWLYLFRCRFNRNRLVMHA